MKSLFNNLLYQPFVNIFALLCCFGDFGLAIIILTLIIRLMLYPLNMRAIKAQKAINDLQPKIKRIEKEYKDDKEIQMQKTLEAYQEAKVNPFLSILPAILQLVVLVALYRAIWSVQGGKLDGLYSFTPVPEEINFLFLGFFDLASVGLVSVSNAIIILGAGALQFYQAKMMTDSTPKKKKSKDMAEEMAQRMQNNMTYLFPFMTLLMLTKLPLAIGFYWLVGNIFAIIQQKIVLKGELKNKK